MGNSSIWGRFVFGLMVTLFLATPFSFPEASADVLPSGWKKEIKDVDGFIQIGGGSTTDEIKRLFFNNALPTFKYLFAFIAILVWTIYVMILLASSGNEETISQQRNNFAWGIVGMILVSLAVGLGEVFTPLSNGQDIIDQPGAQRTFQKIVAFLQMAITIISIIIIFFAGFLFVRSQGDEDSINSAKKYLAWSFIGIIVAVVSVPLVNNVFYPSDETLGDAEIKELANEAGGLLRFFLTFLGVGAMATLVIAGFFYITSFGDDERQEKAKNIIIGSIVGIIVILSAYPIVALFVPNL